MSNVALEKRVCKMSEILRPLRTFADMLEVFKQYEHGLVTGAEAILAMQCTDIQIDCLILSNKLPLKVAAKSSLADWDDHVEMLTDRALAMAQHEQNVARLKTE